VVVVDVDGVVSLVHGTTRWSDDVVAGHVFGPVHVSPAMNAHLDGLTQVPGVQCRWLTSWSREMRDMDPFPGAGMGSAEPGRHAEVVSNLVEVGRARAMVGPASHWQWGHDGIRESGLRGGVAR
jgi:hypothetical protein